MHQYRTSTVNSTAKNSSAARTPDGTSSAKQLWSNEIAILQVKNFSHVNMGKFLHDWMTTVRQLAGESRKVQYQSASDIYQKLVCTHLFTRLELTMIHCISNNNTTSICSSQFESGFIQKMPMPNWIYHVCCAIVDWKLSINASPSLFQEGIWSPSKLLLKNTKQVVR